MDIIGIPRPLTGDALMEEMIKKSDRKMIADNLLYEQTTIMFSADPGCGKSTISAQVAVELALGLPIFGYFHVEKPVKIFYIQAERHILELLERFKLLNETYPIEKAKDNLIITDKYQHFNLINEDHCNGFLSCLRRDFQDAKVLFLDPIYSTVAGGLKEDKPSSAFTKMMSLIQIEFNCLLWYNHHTVKDSYFNGRKVEKDDPYYGSQWLKAHVTGSYHIKSSDVGVNLINKKDNYNILAKSIPLEYNSETGLCSVVEGNMSAIDKLKNFIKLKEVTQKTFYFNQMQEATQLCTRTLRELLLHSSIKDRISVISSHKNKKLYQISQP